MAENGNGDTTNISGGKYKTRYDTDEISPLKNSEKSNKAYNISMPDELTTDDKLNQTPAPKNGKPKLKDRYEELLQRYHKTDKFRTILSILVIILVIIIIFLIVFWPRVPSYMSRGVCTSKNCFDASAQILEWSNQTVDICSNPYEWACGSFQNHYQKHEIFSKNPGEWNFRSYMEYEDMIGISNFISKLPPPVDIKQSPQLILTKLYDSCLNIDHVRNLESLSSLRNAISSVLKGWRILNDKHVRTWSSSNWNFRDILADLQAKYRVTAYYKISVESRKTIPYGNIITISEGDLGLPGKQFYNFEENHNVIHEYKVLLRDVGINIGVVSDKAKIFADEIFNYEKRIVKSTIDAELGGDPQNVNVIMTLKQIQSLASSLPIVDTITSMFSNTQITDVTEVLVKNGNVLKAISSIVSSSDAEVQNNFLAWHLIRKYLPYLPDAPRSALENFELKLYGYSSPLPRWFGCSKLISQWTPFALRALQQNPKLINVPYTNNKKESLAPKTEDINLNNELSKFIFIYIRQAFINAINDASWLNSDITKFINNKLKSMRVQIGIPNDIIKNFEYLDGYYNNFIIERFFLVNQLESHWVFEKEKMKSRLNLVNENDKIIDLLFPMSEKSSIKVKYSPDLNMLIVSPALLNNPYFNYENPISINFARLGSDIAEGILEAIFIRGEEYKLLTTNGSSTLLTYGNEIEGDGFKCIQKHIKGDNTTISQTVKMNAFEQITITNIVQKGFQDFIRAIDKNKPINDHTIKANVTYEMLGLTDRKRLPALRVYDDSRLFTLSYLQRHCSVISPEFNEIKPIIEEEISEIELFNLIWQQSNEISKSMSCSTGGGKCGNILV